MSEQIDDLPHFDNPPIVEAILGVQFDPIPDFTSGHFGWYWKTSLDSTWIKTQEAPLLGDQFERFGDQAWRLEKSDLIAMAAAQPDRLQIINAEDDRLIQIQPTRFIYNWRKREASYPSFQTLYPEFRDKLRGFRDFLRDAGLSDIAPNQWEVTYINQIPKGELWTTTWDWNKVLPGIVPPQAVEGRLRGESGEWHFEIAPERGRLHVVIQHGRLRENSSEILALHLTARGPVHPKDPGWEWESGLELGHRVLVQSFAEIASESAKKHWKLR